MSDTHLNNLIDSNLHVLETSVELLADIQAEQFNHVLRPYFEASLGKHLRHILDHYLCFRRDLESGLINYDQRQRDSQLETDKDYALTVVKQLHSFLESLKERAGVDVNQSLNVIMCNDVTTPDGEMTQSSLGRELQFLQGHSVHHYALMAVIMKFSGQSVSDEFGVAPSTLVHEKAVRESA